MSLRRRLPQALPSGFAELAAGFAIGTATAWRYVREAVTLPIAPAEVDRLWLGVA